MAILDIFGNLLRRQKDKKHASDSQSAPVAGSASPVGRSKTLAECGQEFSDAWRKLDLTVAYELKIDKLCDWLAKILRRFNK